MIPAIGAPEDHPKTRTFFFRGQLFSTVLKMFGNSPAKAFNSLCPGVLVLEHVFDCGCMPIDDDVLMIIVL